MWRPSEPTVAPVLHDDGSGSWIFFLLFDTSFFFFFICTIFVCIIYLASMHESKVEWSDRASKIDRRGRDIAGGGRLWAGSNSYGRTAAMEKVRISGDPFIITV